MAYLELSPEGDLRTVNKMVDQNGHLDVDFLFPNGIVIPLNVDYKSSMDQIKRVS